jgi:hypothetical protein
MGEFLIGIIRLKGWGEGIRQEEHEGHEGKTENGDSFLM